jgi:hypothetical protein
MSGVESLPANSPTQVLRGVIRNYRKTRRTQDFVFTQADRANMRATSIAAGVAGLGGIAVGLAGASLDTSDVADLLEFDVDDKPVRAWVWLSAFQDGDEVEVVAEKVGGVWQGYGIRRPSDKIVALYPHCSRGRKAHRAALLKYWIYSSSIMLSISYLICIFMMYLKGNDKWDDFFVAGGIGGVGCLLITLFIAWRVSSKFSGFVKLAEGVFTAFGWKDVENIDLPAITKKTKGPGDPGPLGVMYFRY